MRLAKRDLYLCTYLLTVTQFLLFQYLLINNQFVQNKKNPNPETKVPPPPAKKPPPPKPTDEKKKQHDALMDEFKKVHRKMFASIDNNEKSPDTQNNEEESLVSAISVLVLMVSDY